MSTVEDRYLLDDDLIADPYPYLAKLREDDPVHWSTVHRSWLVTSYSDILLCLRSSNVSADRIRSVRAPDPQTREAHQVLANWMVFNDPPVHGRLRSAFQDAFTPRVIEPLRPMVRRHVAELLHEAVRRGRRLDLVEEFAHPLPAIIIARWFGVPKPDWPRFWTWARDVSHLVLGSSQDEDGYRTSQRSLLSLFHYLRELGARRDTSPAGEATRDAVVRAAAGAAVSEEERASILTHLAFAGSETTGNLIANGVRALLLNPDQLQILREDPGMLESGVDELLRIDGPSKMSIRLARAAFELNARTVRPRDRLFLIHAAGNRDPRRFPRPDVLDLGRRHNAHLGFGHATHFCLGAALARVVAQEAIRGLIHALPELALESRNHEWEVSLLNRSLKRLPVRF